MKKIIVDTNIIFSALLNIEGNIGNILFTFESKIEIFSSKYMPYEIEKHWAKIVKISKQPEENLKISYSKILERVKFIDEDLIESQNWTLAKNIVEKINLDDIDFVALKLHLNGTLWTGDKPLYNGLKSQNIEVVNTQELLAMLL